MKEPQVRNLIKRISKAVTDEADAKGTYYPKAIIDVKMKNGKNYSTTVEKRKGSPANPLTAKEVREKFLDCSSLVTSGEHAERVADAIMDLENIGDIGRLIKTIVNQ